MNPPPRTVLIPWGAARSGNGGAGDRAGAGFAGGCGQGSRGHTQADGMLPQVFIFNLPVRGE